MASSSASTPPYPSAARISDSQCYQQYTASLKCLEKNHSDKSKCQEQFDNYKECKKKEREVRLERNKNFRAGESSSVCLQQYRGGLDSGDRCMEKPPPWHCKNAMNLPCNTPWPCQKSSPMRFLGPIS